MAALEALGKWSGKAHGQTWMTVGGIRANINGDGGVDRWQVTIEVAFKVDSELRARGA